MARLTESEADLVFVRMIDGMVDAVEKAEMMTDCQLAQFLNHMAADLPIDSIESAVLFEASERLCKRLEEEE